MTELDESYESWALMADYQVPAGVGTWEEPPVFVRRLRAGQAVKQVDVGWRGLAGDHSVHLAEVLADAGLLKEDT